ELSALLAERLMLPSPIHGLAMACILKILLAPVTIWFTIWIVRRSKLTDRQLRRTTSMELEKVDVELAPVLIRLRQLVDWHAMIPDRPLPTERELARQLNISRGALRRGLAQLESEGLIWRRQGKGTFVGPASVSFAPNIKRLSSRTNFFEVMEVRLHIE